jgi:hypothetical protein
MWIGEFVINCGILALEMNNAFGIYLLADAGLIDSEFFWNIASLS